MAVRTEDDSVGPRVRRRQREFRNFPARRDAADLVGGFFCEPQIAVGAGGYADRRCVLGGEVELRERACVRIEAADLRGAAFADQSCPSGPCTAM